MDFTQTLSWTKDAGFEGNKFLYSPLEFKNFVDEIGSPWIGVYFDGGNTFLYGFPQHRVRILGKRIKKVHLKDFLIPELPLLRNFPRKCSIRLPGLWIESLNFYNQKCLNPGK